MCKKNNLLLCKINHFLTDESANNMVAKIIRVSFLSLVLVSLACPRLDAKKTYYQQLADSEMKRNPEGWMLDFSEAPKWNYCQGLELLAILQVWKKTG